MISGNYKGVCMKNNKANINNIVGIIWSIVQIIISIICMIYNIVSGGNYIIWILILGSGLCILFSNIDSQNKK